MLKNVLSLLLSRFYSKKESALVGHQAMPSNQYTRLVSNGTIGSEWTGQAFSGIAAYDGYLLFAGTSTSSAPIVGIASRGASSSLTFPWQGARLSTTIPVTKGASWTVQGSDMKDVIIELTPTIGGGYLRSIVSAICKRGELCLSRLSLYLPRSSCRTNPNGLAVKQTSQSQHPGLFSKLPTTPHKSIRRLRTAGLRLGAPNLASTLVSQVRFNLSSLIRKAISEFLPLFEKATQSAFTAKQKTSNRSRQGSFQTKAPHNLLSMGGALC